MNNLTVGILNRNRNIEICMLLQSLLNQTFQDYNLIIIDDNSNNFLFENQVVSGLLQLHENFNHNVKIIKGKKLGPHWSGQLLLENSNTELIFRLDDDVVLQSDCIEKLLECFNECIVAAGPIYLSPYNQISKQILDINDYPNYLDYGKIKLNGDGSIYVNGILNTTIPINLKTKYIYVEHLHSGFMYRKEYVKKIGGYFLGYSKIAFHEESDLSYRLHLNNGNLVICPDAIAFHYHTTNGGIYTDDKGQFNDKSLWENDEKIFIERFKNEFKEVNIEKQMVIDLSKSMAQEIHNEMIRKPKIHLVTVTYGNHEKLEKLIESVYKYTTTEFSWTVVNNNTSDESYAKLLEILENKQINDCLLFKYMDKEVSISEARNEGARCRPDGIEYICFIDDDALILGKESDNDWLEILYKKFNNEIDIGAVGPICTWFEPLQSYVSSCACLFTSVQIWEQVGGFDPIFGNKEKGTWGYEDTDWSYRLQLLGYKIKKIEDVDFQFYHEDTTNKKKLDWQEDGLIKSKELLLSKYNVEDINKFKRTIYPFTNEQMNIFGKKINIGCYYMKLDNFINIDINPDCNPDIIGDIRELECEDNSVDLILASQVIEHFDLIDVRELLSKFYKWLKSGGHFIIEVPDVGKILDMVECGKCKLEDYLGAIYGNKEIMGQSHKSQFDDILLMNMLKEANFNNIVRNPITSDNDEITLRYDCIKK